MHDQNPPTTLPVDRFSPAVERTVLLVLLAMAVLRAVVAGSTLLSADEAYYWQWSRPLQLSYYDHPAMVAYWIWAGVHTLGESELGVRLAAVVSACAVTVLIWDTARRAFNSPRAGLLAAFWLNSTLLFDTAGVVITPDAPLLLFWSLALWALIRLIREGRPRYLYLTGLALGLGAISKYTMALILPGTLAVFILFQPLRRWWRGLHAYLAGLLALVCLTPLLVWNLQHHGASFHKQLDHAFASQVPHKMANLLAFVGSQIGLVTPVLFAFALWGMGWALWAGWRRRRPEWFLLGATSLPILIFFLNHTQSGVVQAHWSGPAYLGGIMAAAGAWTTTGGSRRWRWAFLSAGPVGLALTLTVFLQATTAILPIPTKIDALKRLGGWQELATAVQEERTAHPGAFLFTQKHEPTGPVSFYLPDHAVVFLQGRLRPSYYTAADVAALKGRDAIFITHAKDDGARDIERYFARVTPLRRVEMHWGGKPADAYNLYLAEGYRGGAFVMGDGFDGAMDGP